MMNWANLLEATLDTLLMTTISTVFAYIIGLPIGILLYMTSKKGLIPNTAVNTILGTIVNIFRSIPCLLLIIILIPITQKTAMQSELIKQAQPELDKLEKKYKGKESQEDRHYGRRTSCQQLLSCFRVQHLGRS